MGSAVRRSQAWLDRYLAEQAADEVAHGEKKKTRAEEEEDYLQLQCEGWLNEREIWFKHDRRSKRERKGIPDLLVCFHGAFVASELKSKDGKVEPDQKIEMAKIRRSGGKTFVARSLEEFIRKLKQGVNERYPR